jgi:hypothetical protein
MKDLRKRATVAAVSASMLVGGAIGATVFSAGASSAAKSTTTTTQDAQPAAPSGVPGGPPPNGQFRPIEMAAHEKGESKAREAQEDAGKVPTIP